MGLIVWLENIARLKQNWDAAGAADAADAANKANASNVPNATVPSAANAAAPSDVLANAAAPSDAIANEASPSVANASSPSDANAAAPSDGPEIRMMLEMEDDASTAEGDWVLKLSVNKMLDSFGARNDALGATTVADLSILYYQIFLQNAPTAMELSNLDSIDINKITPAARMKRLREVILTRIDDGVI